MKKKKIRSSQPDDRYTARTCVNCHRRRKCAIKRRLTARRQREEFCTEYSPDYIKQQNMLHRDSCGVRTRSRYATMEDLDALKAIVDGTLQGEE